VLQALKDNPSGSQTTLVKATDIDRSTLSDLIRRIQRKGWAKRTRSKQDARAWIVQLTPDGHSVLQTAKTAAAKAEKQLADRFPALKTLGNGH
jgi:MarR family transcriptional regulator, temperature-dependent positive regulator of motility